MGLWRTIRSICGMKLLIAHVVLIPNIHADSIQAKKPHRYSSITGSGNSCAQMHENISLRILLWQMFSQVENTSNKLIVCLFILCLYTEECWIHKQQNTLFLIPLHSRVNLTSSGMTSSLWLLMLGRYCCVTDITESVHWFYDSSVFVLQFSCL